MKKVKSRQGKQREAPAPEIKKSYWSVNLTVYGILVGLVLFMVGLEHAVSLLQQRNALNTTIAKWKVRYNLTDEQAASILQTEFKFHGNGSPFSLKPAPTDKEEEAHNLEISHKMASEDGLRFVEDHRRTISH